MFDQNIATFSYSQHAAFPCFRSMSHPSLPQGIFQQKNKKCRASKRWNKSVFMAFRDKAVDPSPAAMASSSFHRKEWVGSQNDRIFPPKKGTISKGNESSSNHYFFRGYVSFTAEYKPEKLTWWLLEILDIFNRTSSFMVDFPASHVSFLGVQILRSCVRSPGAFLMPCGYDQTVSACHISFFEGVWY